MASVATMGLAEDVKIHVRAVWTHVSNRSPKAFGAETLFGLFPENHTTKTYFAHFDLRENSPQIKWRLDEVAGGLSKLSHLHAEKLRGEPSPLLEHYVSGTVACRHHDPPHNAKVLLPFNEFVSLLSRLLSAGYR